MIKKFLLGLLVASIIGLTYMRYGEQPDPFERNSQSYQMLVPGPHEVFAEDIELIDYSRPTTGSDSQPDSDHRQLVTRIWHPAEPATDKPAPLLIYAHGLSSSRVGGSYLAQHLASHGYIVAAPDFPLTNMETSGPKQLNDVVNQPGDISFVIDAMLARSADSRDRLYQAIDDSKIAVAGMSLGGTTAQLLAYHPQLSDPRIALAIAIAAPSAMFPEPFYQHRNTPLMMIASPHDPMVDYERNALPITEKARRSVLVTIPRASHAGFSYQARALRWLNNPDSATCWMMRDVIKPDKASPPWYTLFGIADQPALKPRELCSLPLPADAMNPIKQQWLVILATTSFLQSSFADESSERERQQHFLSRQFHYEHPDVTIQLSPAMTEESASP